MVKDVDYVECPICGKQLRCLNGHLKLHGMTTEAFMEKYPELPLVCSAAHILRNTRKTAPLVQRRLYQYLTGGLGIRLTWEARIGSMFFDMADESAKKAIEVDGTYFHKDEGELDSTQQRNVKFAQRKEQAAKNLGWDVLHITDEELVMQPKDTVLKVLSFLGRDTLTVPDNLNLIPDKRIYCKQCGKHLSFLQIYANKGVCSIACLRAYTKTHPEARPCAECGNTPTPYVLNKHRFCSEACQEAWLTAHIKRVERCRQCGKTLYITGQQPHVFCNSTCQRAYAQEHPDEWKQLKASWSADSEYNTKRRQEGRVEYICANCGKPGWKHARSLRGSKDGNLFCCAACYHAYTKNKPRKRN